MMAVAETSTPEEIIRDKIASPGRKELTELRQVKLSEWPFSTLVRGFADRKKYWAYFLSLLDKVPDETVDTMCVRIENGRYVFCYHPEWYQYLVKEEVFAVIEHECLHIANDHIPRFNIYLELFEDDEVMTIKLSHVFNAAADLAVNTIIEYNSRNSLPQGAMLPQNFQLPKLDAMEFYADELAKRVQVIKLVLPTPTQEKCDDGQPKPGGPNGEKADDGQPNGASGEGEGEQQSDAGGEEGEVQGDSPANKRPEGEHDQVDEEAGPAGDGDPSGAGMEAADPGPASAAGPGGAGSGDQANIPGQNDAGKSGVGAEQLGVTSDDERLNKMMQEQHDWKIRPENGETMRDIADSLEQHAMELMEASVEHFEQLDPSNAHGIIPGFVLQKVHAKRTIHARRWEQLLKEMILDSKKQNQEYRLNVLKPSRMALGSNLGLYGHGRDTLKFCIFIGCDVSGSMSEEALAYGLGVVQEIANSNMDIEVKVVEYDSCIHRRYYLKCRGKPTPEIVGRGGTSFNPFFKEAKEGKDPEGKIFKPDLIINYTDGFCDMPHPDVRMSTRQVPVLWVLAKGGRMPADHNGFGRVVKMDRA